MSAVNDIQLLEISLIHNASLLSATAALVRSLLCQPACGCTSPRPWEQHALCCAQTSRQTGRQAVICCELRLPTRCRRSRSMLMHDGAAPAGQAESFPYITAPIRTSCLMCLCMLYKQGFLHQGRQHVVLHDTAALHCMEVHGCPQ
jgi:hypothetical protein